jgi:hypothetical protein
MEGVVDREATKQLVAQMGEAIVNSDFVQRHKYNGINKGAFPIERELAYRYAFDALNALESAGYKIVKDDKSITDK